MGIWLAIVPARYLPLIFYRAEGSPPSPLLSRPFFVGFCQIALLLAPGIVGCTWVSYDTCMRNETQESALEITEGSKTSPPEIGRERNVLVHDSNVHSLQKWVLNTLSNFRKETKRKWSHIQSRHHRTLKTATTTTERVGIFVRNKLKFCSFFQFCFARFYFVFLIFKKKKLNGRTFLGLQLEFGWSVICTITVLKILSRVQRYIRLTHAWVQWKIDVGISLLEGRGVHLFHLITDKIIGSGFRRWKWCVYCTAAITGDHSQ